MKKIILAATISFLPFFTSQVLANPEQNGKEVSVKIDQTGEVLRQLFSKNNSIDKQLLFSESFLKQVPFTKIQEFLPQYIDDCGDYQSYEKIGETGKLKISFTKANLDASLKLEDGKITGLWFSVPEPKKINLTETLDKFKKLEGQTSLTIRKNGKIISGYNSDIPLGTGSSFKLFILKTLKDKVDSGLDSWDKVIYLDKEKFSLPSGVLHTWPDKSPITLATLANFMISISDNTATDTLIYYLGRENIEKNMPEKSLPLLTTLEMFKIKGILEKEQVNEFLGKTLDEKHKFLAMVDKLAKNKINFPDKPTMIDKIEWLFTTDELCKVIETLKGVPALSINNGIANQDWDYVGYKGGSEPGVLSMTYLLKKKSTNDIYSLSATINNPDKVIDEKKFFQNVSQIVAAIYKGAI